MNVEIDISNMNWRERLEALYKIYEWCLEHCQYYIGTDFEKDKVVLKLKEPPMVYDAVRIAI